MSTPRPAPVGRQRRPPLGSPTLPSRTEVGLAFGAWTLIGLLFGSNMYLSHAVEGEPVPVLRVVGIAAIDVYTWALVTLAAFWASRRFPLERGHLWRNVLALTAVDLSVTLARAITIHSLFQWLEFFPPRSWTQAIFSFVAPNFVSFWMLVGVVHAIDLARRFREREMRAVQLESQLARAQLQMLKMQLHPHFLFNTLHAISSLLHRQPDSAERMIANLSELLRSTLAHQQEQEVTLEEEMALLQPYLEIEQTRLGDRLDLRVEVDPETRSALLPHLILQPLVENSIRHGIAPRRKGGCIRIGAERAGDTLRVRVEDDGRGFAPGHAARAGAVGLANTRARLEQLYGSRHAFTLHSAPDAGTRVIIELPFRPAGTPEPRTIAV